MKHRTKRRRPVLTLDARTGTIGTLIQRRRVRALWQGLRVTDIARQEGVTHSSVSQSISSPAIAAARNRILIDCDRRRGSFDEWKATRLPWLLDHLGLTDP